MSWLPGTHRAEPAATMLRTSRTVSRMRGPRSTRSPTKTALRPSGWAIGTVAPDGIGPVAAIVAS